MSRGPVVFDGSVLGAGPATGVALSFLTTLRAYVRENPSDAVLLLPPGAPDPGIDGLRCVEGPVGALRKQRRLPRLLAELGARLLHSPVTAVPVGARCPTIATVHDLPWHPEACLPRSDPGRNLRHRFAVRLATRHARAIIVPSATTARHLEECAGTDRVHVVPHGVELPHAPADESALVGPFLVLGDGRARKNLTAVGQAHALARQRRPELPDLLRIGPGQPSGYVSEDRKWELLRQSRALVHMAIFEGFGLPVLEAFAHGVPVVCSNRGSLLEVAADAALLADPDDPSAIADAFVRIDNDTDLRARLRTRGLERARQLTAQDTADAWHRLHEEIAPCTL